MPASAHTCSGAAAEHSYGRNAAAGCVSAINTGRMLVGNIGSKRAAEAIRSSEIRWNVAGRLEPPRPKIYGVDIVIGERDGAISGRRHHPSSAALDRVAVLRSDWGALPFTSSSACPRVADARGLGMGSDLRVGFSRAL